MMSGLENSDSGRTEQTNSAPNSQPQSEVKIGVKSADGRHPEGGTGIPTGPASDEPKTPGAEPARAPGFSYSGSVQKPRSAAWGEAPSSDAEPGGKAASEGSPLLDPIKRSRSKKASVKVALEEFTEPYEPDIDVELLPINPEDIAAWQTTLKKDHLIVVCSLDVDVLFAAESRLAGSAAFCDLPKGFVALPNRNPLAFGQTVHDISPSAELLSEADANAGILLVVRAYGARETAAFLQSLPSNPADLNHLQQKLKARNRYILVLTEPNLLEMKDERNRLSSARYPADFLYPYLNDQALAEQAKTLYKAEYWTETIRHDWRLDDDFYIVFKDCLFSHAGNPEPQLEKIANLIREGTGLLQQIPQDPAARLKFKEQLNALIHVRTFRKKDWPLAEDYFSQVLLFVAVFFDGLPVATYERLVRKLLRESNTRHKVPIKTLERNRTITTIQSYEEISWSNLWMENRSVALAACAPICVIQKQPQEGPAVVSCRSSEEASKLRTVFATEYPFTYAEVWDRILHSGLLFDYDRQIIQGVATRIAERAAADPDLFGQAFLRDVLFSPEVLGELEGNLEERFEKLRESRRLPLVLSCLTEVFTQLLNNDRRGIEVGVDALKQVIDGRAPRIALTFLHRLSNHPNLPVARRLTLAKKILNQSGKDYWWETCDLIQKWATNPRDAKEIIKEIVESLPKQDPLHRRPGHVVPVAVVLFGLATDWLQGPSPQTQKHTLAELLGNGSGEELINSLIRWLFHPALESIFAFAFDETPLFFAYWLLAQLAKRDLELTQNFRYLQQLEGDLDREYQKVLDTVLGAGLRPISRADVPAAREFQATVLADWTSGLQRADSASGSQLMQHLQNAQAALIGEDVRRQLHALWKAMEQSAADALPPLGVSGELAPLIREIRERFLEARKVWNSLQEQVRPQTSAAALALRPAATNH